MVRADCKQIGLRSGLNKRKSGFGAVGVTYMKINFGLGPNDPRAAAGEMIKLWPVQTCIVWQKYTNISEVLAAAIIMAMVEEP
jgi:hypothetical protein